MNCDLDVTLYLVTDRGGHTDSEFEHIVEAAIRGGVTLVQLREKTADSGLFYKRAQKIKDITDYYHVPLIINDRVDIMLAVDAAGVHVGQSDIPAAAVRRLIGNDKILGVSAGKVSEAVRAENDGADYLGVGAIFPTDTKLDADHTSITDLAEITKSVHIPVAAIGGIHMDNLQKLAGTGISGVATVSAIMNAKNPEKAAHDMKEKIYGIL